MVRRTHLKEGVSRCRSRARGGGAAAATRCAAPAADIHTDAAAAPAVPLAMARVRLLSITPAITRAERRRPDPSSRLSFIAGVSTLHQLLNTCSGRVYLHVRVMAADNDSV